MYHLAMVLKKPSKNSQDQAAAQQLRWSMTVFTLLSIIYSNKLERRKGMKFNEVMSLEINDGIIYDGKDAVVSNIKNLSAGQKIYGKGYQTIVQHNIKEIEITLLEAENGELPKRYLTIYTDYPEEAHNQTVLNRLEIWNPLGFA